MNLKLPASRSDTPGMHFAAEASPETGGTGLRSLRLSLNAPVVAVDELPVGPARAGIALHAGAAGEPRLTVAVRSLRTGRVVCYRALRERGEPIPPELALEAALSFAEGMGFLFDEEEVGADGEEGSGGAVQLWRELLGTPSPPDDDAPEAGVQRQEDEVGPRPGWFLRSPPLLTKFRRAAAGAPPSARPGSAAPDPGCGEPCREGMDLSPEAGLHRRLGPSGIGRGS